MEFLIKAGQLILSLSILIVLHEFGHYLPARWFNTRVEKFYLFFDYKFSLFKKKIKDTEWGIGWIPLGGYVKISGMIDESMDTEQMQEEPKPYEFRTKPAWQRLIIMIGGITVNMIVAILIYWFVLFGWGDDVIKAESVKYGYAFSETMEKYGFEDGDNIIEANGEAIFDVNEIPSMIMVRGARDFKVDRNGEFVDISLPEEVEWELFENEGMGFMRIQSLSIIDTVLADMPAAKAGLKKGDKILAVNGGPIPFWHVLSDSLKNHKNKNVDMLIERNSQEIAISIQTDSTGAIGVAPQNLRDQGMVTHVDYGFGESFTAGIGLAVQTLSDYAAQLKFLFSKKGASSIGGFGAFGSIFSPTWDWHTFWLNTAFISVILAFMNFLPIPALDGGHIMFLLYEIVTGRKPNEKIMQYATMIGIILILGLVLFANGNDVFRWITGG